MKTLMEQHAMDTDLAVQKKQYIQICSLEQKDSSGILLKFKEIAKLLDIKEDDVEEWAIEAINNDIIDARIDQINSEIVIKTHKMAQLDNKQWLNIKSKVT